MDPRELVNTGSEIIEARREAIRRELVGLAPCQGICQVVREVAHQLRHDLRIDPLSRVDRLGGRRELEGEVLGPREVDRLAEPVVDRPEHLDAARPDRPLLS